MNNNQFFISEESFIRAKKQLKKSLINEGFNVNLSQCANLLAKSFGYNDEYRIQEFIKQNNKVIEKNKPDNCLNENPKNIPSYNPIMEYDIKSNFNRLFPEHRYFNDIILCWHCLNDYFKFRNNIFNIIEKLDSKLTKEKCISIFKIIDNIESTIRYLEKSKIIGESIFLFYERNDNYKNIIQFNEIIDEIIDLYNLMEDEIGKDEILKGLIFKMYRLENIEKYFYLNKDERSHSVLKVDSFESEYYKESLEKCQIRKKDFKGCKDILILAKYGDFPELIATVIKENIKDENENIEILSLYEDLFYNIPHKNNPKIKRIYIAYIYDYIKFTINNFDDVKKKLKKESNEDFDFNEISLFLRAKCEKNKISYSKVNFK